jgi:hypothetical protein
MMEIIIHPVEVDMKRSAFVILSALLQDKFLGRVSGLYKNTTGFPDAYTVVADILMTTMRRKCKDEFLILLGVDRKMEHSKILTVIRPLVKKATITAVYSSRVLTQKNYFFDALKEHMIGPDVGNGDFINYKNLKEVITRKNYPCLKHVSDVICFSIVKLLKGFYGLKQTMDHHMNVEDGIRWETPGFFQRNTYYAKQTVVSKHRGYNIIFPIEGEVNEGKHKLSVLVNIVHSLDARVLYHIIVYLRKQGVNALPIHDSFVVR